MYPSGDASDGYFSGEIMVTDMDGHFLNGYRVNYGALVAQLSTKDNYDAMVANRSNGACPDHGDCFQASHCVYCVQDLGEVIITTGPEGSGSNNFPITFTVLSKSFDQGGGGPYTGMGWDYYSYGGGGSGAYNGDVVKINNNLTNPCAKNIFSQLEIEMIKKDLLQKIMKPTPKMSRTFSESILKLFNDSNTFNLSIANGYLKDANGSTSGASITISDSYLKNATQLSIARTMIHEMVHA